MRPSINFLAVDLGASNGRVFCGRWNGKKFELHELHRFFNRSVDVVGHLHWDVLRLWSEVKTGLSYYSQQYNKEVAGIGVDAWGVDFAMLDKAGRLLGNPYSYRDRRTEQISKAVFAQVPEREVFKKTGVQSWPINSLFQIFSMVQNADPQLEAASTFLMIPDLFTFWLCGVRAVELTVGSTSEMLQIDHPQWAYDLLTRLGIPSDFLPSITKPGTTLGPLRSALASEMNFTGTPPVLAVATHDTASTVAAIPGMNQDSIFISSGTWSLMGVQTARPVTSPQALNLGFSNERGASGSVLLLCNIPGLWPLQECMRQWQLRGSSYTWGGLTRLAEEAKGFRSLINPDALDFVAPQDMLVSIRDFCRRTNQQMPDSAGAFTRCCIESLSLRYRQVLESLESLVQRRLSCVRVAGGGCLNRLLCQFTANATNRAVIAGPVEASVLGNIMTQAIAIGHIKNFSEGSEAIASSIRLSSFEPRKTDAWEEAFQRFRKLL